MSHEHYEARAKLGQPTALETKRRLNLPLLGVPATRGLRPDHVQDESLVVLHIRKNVLVYQQSL